MIVGGGKWKVGRPMVEGRPPSASPLPPNARSTANLGEAKRGGDDVVQLVDGLERIALGRMYVAGQKAMVRLHLFVTGQIHEKMLELTRKARAALLKQADRDGMLDGLSGYYAQTAILDAWSETLKEFTADLYAQRREAAGIAFGVMGVMHSRLVGPVISDQSSVISGGLAVERGKWKVERGIEEAVRVSGGVFEPQMAAVLNAAAEHVYGDGLNLSARIWKLDRESREGLNRVLMQGIANGDSAWNIAKNLEQFLGANADCPRWTSTRLYGRTKAEIARGDLGGLVTGSACDGQGVSHNALRLARTEIQRAHAQATDKTLAMQPWVLEEQTNLSPAHAEADECDEVANGGEKSDGVYPVGTIGYPLHPNCMCFKTAVMMPQEEFTTRLRSWRDGVDSWPGMDEYAREVGLGTEMKRQPVTLSLAVWLLGEGLEKWMGGAVEG